MLLMRNRKQRSHRAVRKIASVFMFADNVMDIRDGRRIGAGGGEWRHLTNGEECLASGECGGKD